MVADERDDGLDQPAALSAYWPPLMDGFSEPPEQFVMRSMAIMIRTSGAGTESFLTDVRKAVWSVDPNLPLADVRTYGGDL